MRVFCDGNGEGYLMAVVWRYGNALNVVFDYGV